MFRKIVIPILILALLGTIGGNTAMADTGEMAGTTNASEVWRALQRLQTTATVLHTVAHPDDENGALLTWLSRARGIRTGLYSTTRGEGGANLIGSELFDALGIVRTEEHLASVRYYGIDLFFSSAVDFGYSKRLDETLEKWDYEMLLEDMVRLIRFYRPDVIISRFQGNRQDGHGHHQASGVVTLEAFRVAGDVNRFPEHLSEGLHPWQPKKLYISRSRWRRSNTATGDAPVLKIDTGEYNALLGLSYSQIARQGLSYQRSQGAGQTRASKGSSVAELRLVDTTLSEQPNPENTLFDGLDTTISDMAKLANTATLNAEFAQLQNSVDAAVRDYDARQPWTIVPHLVSGLRTTRGLIEKIQEADINSSDQSHLLFLLRNKEQEFMTAANAALGVSLEVLVQPTGERSLDTFTVAIPGQKFSIGIRMVNPAPVAAEFINAWLDTPEGWDTHQIQGDEDAKEMTPIETNKPVSIAFGVEVPQNAAYTQPYWSRASEYHDAVYTLNHPAARFLPFTPPEVHGVVTYRVDGVDFIVTQPAQTRSINRPWGERRRLLTVAPAISLSVSPRIGVIPISESTMMGGKTTFIATVEMLNNVKGESEGTLSLKLPDGWQVSPENAPFAFTHEGASKTFTFQVSTEDVEAGSVYTIQAVATHNGKEYTTGYQTIDHRDLEPRHLYHSATMTLHSISLELPQKNLSVGYIMGVGDKVPEALEQIGIDVEMLDREELRTGDLNRFDTILVGIRAYAVRRDLVAYNSRLLDYVHKGGNLIVQYQTPEFDAAPFGPYPYTMGRRPEEVSEEDSQVTILMPDNPIFRSPNQITEADFDGWVEERGSKFLTEWDANYQALLTCNDREQEPQHGGFMYAEYGQGTYTYAAYAFYRQLPAGVGGAYRLFINMLTLGQ
ncbi:MAG: PIG-L family deacetylase [Candidatus Poribacteria bacterium]|nr:PIG-L family deacetylase [Candidatus Poribacteria bacterium]